MMPYLSANQISIYYEIHENNTPTPDSETILLIHGLGSSTLDWENQIAAFSAQYRVIAFDLRGHGKTDKPDTPYSVVQFANDTAELIKALSPQQKVHVIGHSLGGMVAFQLVLDFPDKVKSLTIVNSAPAVVFPSLTMAFGFYLRKYIVKLFGVKPLSAKLAKTLFPHAAQAKLRETMIQRWCHNDPRAYLNALAAFPGWNVMPRLSEIQCPTLIVSADHDYTPPAAKIFYAKWIKQAEVVIIPDSYHMTIIDQPVAFNEAVLNFLNKVGK